MTIIFEHSSIGQCPFCENDDVQLYVAEEYEIVTCGRCTIVVEQLDIGQCLLCKCENWLYFTPALKLTACGNCTTRLANTHVIDTNTNRKTETQKIVEKIYGTG